MLRTAWDHRPLRFLSTFASKAVAAKLELSPLENVQNAV